MGKITPVRVAIAGSTGSIGTQTLDVIRGDPNHFRVSALAAGSSIAQLIEQANEFRPEIVVVSREELCQQVAAALPFAHVTASLTDVVEVGDVVVNAVVGFAGLPVTLETLRAGKRLALANKESLIAAGPIVQPLRRTPGALIVPVDSEHCAIHQCLRSTEDTQREVQRLVLTASGGPFRGKTRAELSEVTVANALAHPTWSMGPKITVDSSTLMNKGLEVIEAHELFGTSYDSIDVVVHPQSVVHSMVEFTDGSTIAQLSMPDMRLPISYALGYPHRSPNAFGAISWRDVKELTFSEPDVTTFRCLAIAYEVGRMGGTAPAFMSAANEVAVEAFLAGSISWLAIADTVDAVMQKYSAETPSCIEDILNADARGREAAKKWLAQ
ncbi:MAG: 1-deoxy-D-xylulose-5-phosphate reductoisomerase [bacterium]